MKQTIGPLGEIDLLTSGELKDTLGHHFSALIREFYRAESFMRLPLVTGQASGGVLTVTSGVGPQQGYAWDIGHLGIAGLTTGATPDVVNVFFDGGPAVPWWQLNGNSFATTFSRGQLVMYPGETITLRSVGTFAATGIVTLFGMIRTQMPTEKLSKVLG